MQDDLNKILSDLSQIIGLLEGLADQLALDTTEIETYIAGISAKDAITTIKTHYGPEEKDQVGSPNTLKYYSYLRSKDSDPTTKALIATLVDNINGTWDIETQVTAIHDAIIPDIGSTEGLLDLWTDTFILQGHVSDDQLMDYYKTLEMYFGVLLFYQFKGANMVVEALNYEDVDGNHYALNYLTGTFQPQIKEQTDRFLKCVTRLIANNCGLYWERRFLPSTAQEILARATFFVTQTLGEDHYGLRVGLFGTSNLVHDILYVGALKGDDLVMVPGEMVDVDVPDRPYDSWGTLKNTDLNTLSKGTSYSLDKFDFGAFDPGTYEVYYSPAIDWAYVYVGEAVVKTYTNDYIEDPDGEITYGYLLGEFRRGGKEVMMDPSVFKHAQYSVDKSGDVAFDHSDWLDEPNHDLFLNLTASNTYTNTSSSIKQKLEWTHPFTFSGTESTDVYLNIAGDVHGSVYIHHENFWSNSCKICVHFGVWNQATHDGEKSLVSCFVPSTTDKTQPWHYTLNDQIKLTLEPGVPYYVYANVWGSGENYSGDYDYEIHLDNLNHLSLTFVNSEFSPQPQPQP